MGIRGLYSYIQEFADASLAWHKLRNCKLVIDGNNLAHEIYGNSPGINPAFGGDYDKYAVYIENFFNKLSECNVDPIVIMDGGYPMLRNKFKTVYSRLTDQMDTCRKINPDNQDSMKVFPIMARSVFVYTIHKLGVRVLQADFEADDEIVVVAKELGAYVLSNDSDFYIFDVPFILLHSVNMKHVQKEQIKGGKISKFIPCYRFDTEKFCKITGVRRELIPLLAPLLGNDYFNPKCMLPFYKSIFHLRPNSKKISARKKVIISVLRWLANQDGSPDDIIKKIVNAKDLSKYFTPGTRNGLRKAFEMYFPSSSYFTPWISQHEKTCFAKSAGSSDGNSENKYSVNFEEYFLGSQNLIEELHCTCKSKSDSTILSNGELPDKFIRAFRLGLIPHSIVDFLTKDYFFTVPQIEANERECLYVTFFQLIKDLRALLWITYARGNEYKNSETIDKNLAILDSNVPNNSSKQVSCIETHNTVESNKENEKTDEVIQVSGDDYKEIDEDRECSKKDGENCDGKSNFTANDVDETENILRKNENDDIDNDKKLISNIPKNLCDEKFSGEYIHEPDKENEEVLVVCIKEELCVGREASSFGVEKTSVLDDKDIFKENQVSKLICDVSENSLRERDHKISEKIDAIATLKMNYYDTSKKNNNNYYDSSRKYTLNMNNCDTSRNEIVDLADCDTSENETLNLNNCDPSRNNISSEENRELKLSSESHNDLDDEGVIPNKNDDDKSEVDLSIEQDEDEEYKEVSTDDDDDAIDLEGDEETAFEEDTLEPENIQKLMPFEILYIPSIRMFYRFNNSFKVKHFPQEEIKSYSNLPSLFQIQTYTEKKKIDLFYKLINFKRKFRTSLSIEFIILCICFWKKHFFRHAKLNNILSVLVCVVMFYVIDRKLGRIRYKRSPEEVASFQRKINNMKQSGKLEGHSSMSVEELIENLTKEECKLAGYYMNRLHIIDPKVDRRNYDRCAVHSFSEFQATVFFLQFLNSLLYFPFPVISMDSMWSGTFCYNVLNWLDRTNDVNILLATLFANNERMRSLYIKLYSLVKQLSQIPGVESTFNNELTYSKEVKVMRKKLGVRKIPRKKCKKEKKEVNNEEEKIEYSTEELLLLAENKFSALAVV